MKKLPKNKMCIKREKIIIIIITIQISNFQIQMGDLEDQMGDLEDLGSKIGISKAQIRETSIRHFNK